MLRVGRSYAATSSERAGLMFMCVNADIERQFEFVQRSWLIEPSFHGLENETDALLGRADAPRDFTIPIENAPLRLRGLRDFVGVRGGGYFFMPSRAAFSVLARYR
jgi:deferrochelatase/peroxidase EfeB